jgi:glucose-1-phosphate thymidylyltransferase
MMDAGKRTTDIPEIVGLLPAAGLASRLSPLPCSKELLPVGYDRNDAGRIVRPKPVCTYLLDQMSRAGARKAFVVLRKGKWDIPAYLENGCAKDMNIAYLMMRHPFGAPYTIDEAYPFVASATILFGFPDILFEKKDAFMQLVSHLDQTGADAVLGLFPVLPAQKADMVDIDDGGLVKQILIKPAVTNLNFAWIIAAWKPAFTVFMHDYLIRDLSQRDRTPLNEIYMGNVLQAAVEAGLMIQTLSFPGTHFYDIGTPEGLSNYEDAVHQGRWGVTVA